MFKWFLAKINFFWRRALSLPIYIYRYTVSPVLGQRCRFYPSCSHYALEAISTHSLLRALWLIGKRLLKCQPWHKGGFDPVPPKKGVKQ
jgi:hypothetical protein